MRVFGIRHHGPGSARRLLAALDAYAPDLLLLEMPADAAGQLTALTDKDLRPPVALVLYDAKDIENAAFYPFATFSPEYQALRWAAGRNVTVTPIDLPARHFLAAASATVPPTLFASEPVPSAEPSSFPGKTRAQLTAQLRRDPLSLMAELAGYTDSESWWDATLERSTGGPLETFAALREMVGALREAFPEASDAENERREAFMRSEIRKARKAGAERIAVVVGAWHAPALADVDKHRAAADKARLRGLPRVKTAAAWVPWSYPRLTKTAGYGAGVQSPSYYRLLFDFPTNATDRWMATAAKLLRAEDYDASPALATEGVALARTLATLRGHERPGISELEEALLGTLAAGRAERLALIHEKLTVGTTVGFVPPGVTTVPLVADLNRELKSTRMAKLWETAGQHYLKASKQHPRGGIDLRAPNDLRKSHLLHRLNLLEVRWGKLQPLGPDAISSFREIWLLEWQPEFSLYLLERASYGNTLPLAAARYARERAGELTGVRPLTELTLDCLRADLPEVVPEMMDLVRQRAAATTDVASLLAALPALVRTSRYGDSRRTDTSALVLVIDELLPRLTAGLPAAATGIDDEQAGEIKTHLGAANYALAQLDRADLSALWRDGIRRTTATPNAHELVTGYGVRLLYEAGELEEAETARRFSRALSVANGARSVAHWLDGFLYGSGQLLFHYRPLYDLLDGWLNQLAWEDFESVLPQLRRTFSDFSVYDRQRLLRLVSTKPSPTPEEKTDDPAAPSAPQSANQPAEHPAEDLVEELLKWMG